MKNKKAIVIGAGIGGLSSACLLAADGLNVTLFEKNSTPGGKMQEYIEAGYRFDTGPSLLTMPFIVEKLFATCGRKFSNYISLTEPEPLCRYFFNDETRFDSFSDREKAITEVQNIAPEDAAAYREFLRYSEELFKKTADPFLFNPLYDFGDLKSLKWTDLLSIGAFSTVSEEIDRRFKSRYMRQFFKRFATYNGSSPYSAPATLNVIPHAELNMGGYYVKGGLYTIARSLETLAKELGVTFRYNSEVSKIVTDHKTASSIELAGGENDEADFIFANSDAADTVQNMLPSGSFSKMRLKSPEPSSSGFVVMLGCSRRWEQLKHHNVFFSNDYRKEFLQIFDKKQLPGDPTIYIANTSFTDNDHAPPGSSNLFIMVNAPSITENQDWESLSINYKDVLVNLLEKKGLIGLKKSIRTEKILTPLDFLKLYGSYRGSIYGRSSNSKTSAFLRPRNKLRGFSNIYLTGGSTHPGGGIPLVVLSAFNAVELMHRDS